MTWDDVRRLVLRLPAVEADSSYGRPAFRVAGKPFAWESPHSRGALCLRCDIDDRRELIDSNRDTYFVTPHYEQSPVVLVHVAYADPDDLFDRIEDSWLSVAPNKLADAYVATREDDRNWCVELAFASTASRDDIDAFVLELEMKGFDIEADPEAVRCFFARMANPRRVKKKLGKIADDAGVGDVIAEPMRVLRWDRTLKLYIDPANPPQEDPRPHATEIAWAVDVQPRDAFVWRDAREALEERYRIIDVLKDGYTVGARDESEATAIADEIAQLDIVRAAVPRPLSRFGRWRVRQRLLGNYGDTPDPTRL